MATFDDKDISATSTRGLDLGHGYAEDDIQEKARLLGCSPEDFLEARENSKNLSLEDAASVSLYTIKPE